MDIRRADQQDLPAVAATLHDAFRHDPVSTWVFPDPDGFERHHAAMMRLFAQLALATGEVWLTPDAQGVALWYVVDPAASADDAALAEIAQACGPYAGRFVALGKVVDQWHPRDGRHLYLHLLAVRPGAQGRGLGTALLRDRLRRTPELPAYLESSSPRSATLYAREGFTHRTSFDLPEDGPTFFPMWRDAS